MNIQKTLQDYELKVVLRLLSHRDCESRYFISSAPHGSELKFCESHMETNPPLNLIFLYDIRVCYGFDDLTKRYLLLKINQADRVNLRDRRQ